MNILFVIPEYYPHSGGGISTYYINYLKALRPHCNKIKVIVGSGYFSANSSFSIDGVEVETLNPELYNATLGKFTRFDINPILKNNLAAAWAMYEQVNKGNGFDIIECTDFALGFIPWVINHTKPVITRLHGSIGQISLHENNVLDPSSDLIIKQTELLLLPLCNALITHSNANKLFWDELLNTTTEKIDPVFNVSAKQPLPMAERENIGLVTARIQRWKGPVELCMAMELIDENCRPNIKWVGRDVPFTREKNTGQYLSETFPNVWNKKICPQPPVNNNSVAQLQQKVRFGIVPSTWDMYNFTCVEFLAAGTPVICSDGAGVSDIINHGKNGLKYSANDVQGLVDCLKHITQISASEYEEMAQAAIETVKRMSPENIIPQNLQQYTKVLSEFKNRGQNLYLRSIFSPEDIQHTINEILDSQPLKKIFRYVFKRLLIKITGNK